MLITLHHCSPNQLLDSTDDALVNPVNCVGIMGKGLALEFKRKWPAMFDDYKHYCDSKQLRPGLLHTYRLPTGQLIINFPTKDHWRNPSKLEWVESGLQAVNTLCLLNNICSVSWPLLGAGNGGLDAESVIAVMHRLLDNRPAHHTLYLLN